MPNQSTRITVSEKDSPNGKGHRLEAALHHLQRLIQIKNASDRTLALLLLPGGGGGESDSIVPKLILNKLRKQRALAYNSSI